MGCTLLQLTFFSLFNCLDKVIHKVLQIAQGVRDTSSLVNLSERRVEDGDDILKEIRRGPLLFHEQFSVPVVNGGLNTHVPRISARSSVPCPAV